MSNSKKSTSDVGQIIEEELGYLLDLLQIEAKIEVLKDKDQGHFSVDIQTEESGLLIGRYGETINSLQLLLGVIIYKKTGQWARVVLDIGGYREGRKATIAEMVGRIVEEVKANHQPVVLPYLSPYERRIVHLMLKEEDEVVSQSEGEGYQRRVVIKPKEISN